LRQNSNCAGGAYCVRVLIEAERPLGERTVVVQLLKAAKMRMAPSVERRMVRMMFSFGFLLIRSRAGK